MRINKTAAFLFICASLSATAQAESSKPNPHPNKATTALTNANLQRLLVQANLNVLLKPWVGPYGGVPPWNQAQAKLVPAALTLGIDLQRAEIAKITGNPTAPTFANTIEALQNAGRHLGRATLIFNVMTENISNGEIQALEAEWSPKLTAAENEITFDRKLFERVHKIYAAREKLPLAPDQRRLLERTHDQFVRAGAGADAGQQKRLSQISEQLSRSYAEFSRRLLADENTAIFISDAAAVADIPEGLRNSYAAAARERGRPGEWAVTNTRSSVDPFLTFAKNRSLREKVWRAFKNRGDNKDGNDTNQTITEILALRSERAKLLGFADHAYYRMSDTMAKEPSRAMDLMMRVWKPAVARVHEEVRDMQKIADAQGSNITIEPWDYLYYAEQVRRDRYNLDQNEVRSYFQLNKMIDASYYMANQLYGLTFKEITGTVPVFHPDVRTFEVHDRDGKLIGLFYRDDFARPGKRSGAWAQGYQGYETFTQKQYLPITSNNNNFVRGENGKPVLISLDDARTLFHEFGHALHALMNRARYPGLSNTPRDYVEFPSQVHEHWVLTPPILERFAKHVVTGKSMPIELVNRINQAETFNQGYETVETVGSALVDMALHHKAEPVTDADAFEKQTLEKLGMPREIAMRHRLPQFGHLFSSDSYSAGYYSYLWSEVMDADTWEKFTATGNVFDRATADAMRTIILSEGNSSDRAEAYRRFRGRDPDVKALLRVRGFPLD